MGGAGGAGLLDLRGTSRCAVRRGGRCGRRRPCAPGTRVALGRRRGGSGRRHPGRILRAPPGGRGAVGLGRVLGRPRLGDRGRPERGAGSTPGRRRAGLGRARGALGRLPLRHRSRRGGGAEGSVRELGARPLRPDRRTGGVGRGPPGTGPRGRAAGRSTARVPRSSPLRLPVRDVARGRRQRRRRGLSAPRRAARRAPGRRQGSGGPLRGGDRGAHPHHRGRSRDRGGGLGPRPRRRPAPVGRAGAAGCDRARRADHGRVARARGGPRRPGGPPRRPGRPQDRGCRHGCRARTDLSGRLASGGSARGSRQRLRPGALRLARPGPAHPGSLHAAVHRLVHAGRRAPPTAPALGAGSGRRAGGARLSGGPDLGRVGHGADRACGGPLRLGGVRDGPGLAPGADHGDGPRRDPGWPGVASGPARRGRAGGRSGAGAARVGRLHGILPMVGLGRVGRAGRPRGVGPTVVDRLAAGGVALVRGHRSGRERGRPRGVGGPLRGPPRGGGEDAGDRARGPAPGAGGCAPRVRTPGGLARRRRRDRRHHPLRRLASLRPGGARTPRLAPDPPPRRYPGREPARRGRGRGARAAGADPCRRLGAGWDTARSPQPRGRALRPDDEAGGRRSGVGGGSAASRRRDPLGSRLAAERNRRRRCCDRVGPAALARGRSARRRAGSRAHARRMASRDRPRFRRGAGLPRALPRRSARRLADGRARQPHPRHEPPAPGRLLGPRPRADRRAGRA